MSDLLQYDPSAAHRLLKKKHLRRIEPDLLAARDEVLQDVGLLRAAGSIPKKKRPLDAGFIDLPKRLLTGPPEGEEGSSSPSLLVQIEAAAHQLRNELDRLVLLGIGGSYMGARALFEALCHPHHNELDRERRGGIPRLYFQGNNLDNDAARGLLELLKLTGGDSAEFRDRWGIVVISKSGGTIETAVAFRLFRQALEEFYGPDSDESRRFVVPVTGAEGRLRDFSRARDYPHVFPIPDDVGGRFSIFTAVGLVPAAVLGLDVRRLLQGAADMTERFSAEPFGANPVLDYVAVCHLMEAELGMNIRVLSTWGSRLEAAGLWYDQLLSESLGKDDRGATPLTAVNTRDLHSRGQQHQEGTRDKLITNVIVREPSSQPLTLSAAEGDAEQLNHLAGRTMPELLAAALEGTNRAYADAERPTADVVLPRLDEYAMGQLFQMLMLATVVEGRLIGVNPYGQPGVEAYKKNMAEVLARENRAAEGERGPSPAV